MLGNIVKVTPSSKVVGDLAIIMHKNRLTPENVLTEGKNLSYPDSVIDYFSGMIGQPDCGFPEALREIVLKGKEPINCRPGQLLPVDSEHAALFQCLVGEDPAEVAKLWITASGGPFRGKKRSELASVTRDQALAHPNWVMGAKISIDSATLMNKGLEVIEAHHLFAKPYSNIKVVQHPQSCIHSLVEYVDGSFKAHLGVTDMRVPIQYALSYPERWPAAFEASLDLCQLGTLDFSAPDTDTFGCLRLAREAGEAGGTLPCVLNAANEIAVAAFLASQIGFLDIERIVESCLEDHNRVEAQSIEQLLAIDAETRSKATRLAEK
jgi:1-deoxy-D-xylulose-5-phosphate reductoisomerase